MPFRPKVNDALFLANETLTVTEHPSAKGMPYGQTGHRAKVYQLIDGQCNLQALKVFTLAFRSPQIELQADAISWYAALPGLKACRRRVLSPARYADIIGMYPDLRYAVLMPWIHGMTWQEMMLTRTPITRSHSLLLAESLVRVLAVMEQNGMAHCDLSGPNVIIRNDDSSRAESLALIDLEDLYAPGLQQPEMLPGGSTGYAHSGAKGGIWSPLADRFAGSVLLAEMLGWCTEDIPEMASGEQFFDLNEGQMKCGRQEMLSEALEREWGGPISRLFNRAWNSSDLKDCPTFAEWAAELNVPIESEEVSNKKEPISTSPLKGWRTFTGECIQAAPTSLSTELVEDIVAQETEPVFNEWENLGPIINAIDETYITPDGVGKAEVADKRKLETDYKGRYGAEEQQGSISKRSIFTSYLTL